MVQSKAATVAEYLEELSPERRAVIAAVRRMVLDHLPAGYEEGMLYGMIAYSIPLSRYPDTYNGQPLTYAGLAAQKNNYALYLTGCYADPKLDAWLRAEYRKAGKRLDMGKSCLRFRSLDDLLPGVVAKVIARMGVKDYLALYEAVRAATAGGRKAAKKAAKKGAGTAPKKAPKKAAKVTPKPPAKRRAAKSAARSTPSRRGRD